MRIFGKNDTKLLMGDGTGGGTGCAGRRPRNISVTINICREPACPITVFSLMFMLHRNGLWIPEQTPDTISGPELLAAFKREVLEPALLSGDDEVWPLVETLQVDREQVDRAAREQFPGYAFYWNYNVDTFNAFDKHFIPERRFCVDPVHALAVMARLNGGFYHSERSPDYSIGHICDSGVAFSDPRFYGEPMYPLWNQKTAGKA